MPVNEHHNTPPPSPDSDEIMYGESSHTISVETEWI